MLVRSCLASVSTCSSLQKIKAMFPKNDTLAEAFIWPDEIRKALPEMNPLHYVNVPRQVQHRMIKNVTVRSGIVLLRL